MSIPMVALGSGAAVIACGDVPTGGVAALTAEGWFRVLAISAANRPLLSKYGTGHEWALYITRDGRVYFVVWSASGTNAAYSAVGALRYNRLTHLAGCYDGSHCKVFVNGEDVTATSRLVGGAVADTAEVVRIGGYIGDVGYGFIGRVGWQRISDVCRYPAAPAGPELPPAVDGNTLALWQVDEGAGSTLDNAEGTAAYDGTITAGTWVVSQTNEKSRAQPVLAAGFGRRLALGARWGT